MTLTHKYIYNKHFILLEYIQMTLIGMDTLGEPESKITDENFETISAEVDQETKEILIAAGLDTRKEIFEDFTTTD